MIMQTEATEICQFQGSVHQPNLISVLFVILFYAVDENDLSM